MRLIKNTQLVAVLGVISLGLLTAGVRIGYLVEPPNVDQGVMLSIAVDLAAGKSLYTEVWNHHLPICHYLYAIGFCLFGKQLWFFNLLEVVNALIAGLLLFFLLCRSFDREVAFLGCFTYALLFNHVLLGGWYSRSQPEVFLEVPLLAIFLLGYGGGANTRRTLVAQGVLWAVLLLTKITAAVFLVCIWAEYYPRSGERRGRTFLARIGWFLAGFTALALVFVIWCVAQGNLAKFWDYIFVYHYYYRSSDSLLHLWHVVEQSSYLAPVALMAVYGYFTAWKHRRIALAAWPVAALLQVVLQGKYWWYHFIPCITPLCVFAAFGTARMLKQCRLTSWKVTVAGLPATLLLLMPFFQVCQAYYADHRIWPYLAGQITRREFLASYQWNYQYQPLVAWQAGQYIKSTARKNDRLLVLGYCSILYLYADLPRATKYPFFSINMFPNDHYREVFLKDMYRELFVNPPRFIAITRDAGSFYGLSFQNPPTPEVDRISKFIAWNYRPTEFFPGMSYVPIAGTGQPVLRTMTVSGIEVWEHK